MKLAIEFPAVSYREGPAMVARMAKGIEDIGYDQLDIYDHVIMGYDIEGRDKSYYSAKMPVLEAVATLSFAAAVTDRIGLGTEVLVLPQRQPALVAKQFSTLDMLSGGRARLGIGVGWQASEFEALGEEFKDRGARTDEAIEFIRTCWREDRIDFDGEYYNAEAMAMEPGSPQGADLPIWVGGNTPPAFRRVGKYGDGWLASRVTDADFAKRSMDAIREAAVAAGRDPDAIGWQSMIAPPPRPGDDKGKTFYAEPDRVAARAADLKKMGFDAVALNATAIFQSGARSVEAILDALQVLHDRIRTEVG
ncbi:MAG: TIGR03619 family F420-dependent LLM class oxidoreductase [Rhodospirillaceae bacterium]|jgi:probable F420-dependent oxidoreductase|nr:TIGR03619 family F420-dependent LLM class oxidoreductase [Rhodospirillaceae bacterium]MBT5666106.1 TIGR03619 family F420-dependent LLM class oxidoreductase [Rhodospirillaceae bacterium]MBT5809174.1 TIGR03619 family F420-dependent LLM class oxidoreductase [Rhodospirillaceae bacterium]